MPNRIGEGNAGDDLPARQSSADEFLIAGRGDLVGDHLQVLEADLLGHPEDPGGAVERAAPGLHDHQHRVDATGSGAPQVFDARLAIHHQRLLLVQHQIGHQRPDQDALRAGAPGSARLDRPQHQKSNSLMEVGVIAGDIRHLRVHLEELPVASDPGAGALLDEDPVP